jgi:hypothetical protein
MSNPSPYLTAREAAARLRFEYADGTPNVSAFYAWRYRHRTALRAYKGRGKLLFKAADVDAALDREGKELDAFLSRRRA